MRFVGCDLGSQPAVGGQAWCDERAIYELRRHGRGKKSAGVKPAPPRKNLVRGGAGFTPAGIPTANRHLRTRAGAPVDSTGYYAHCPSGTRYACLHPKREETKSAPNQERPIASGQDRRKSEGLAARRTWKIIFGVFREFSRPRAGQLGRAAQVRATHSRWIRIFK
jgi:hypothetical protein